MRKRHLTIGNLLCLIALTVFLLMFLLDAFLCLGGFGLAAPKGSRDFVTNVSLSELIICFLAFIVSLASIIAHFRKSAGLFDLKPFINVAIVAVYSIIVSVSVLTMIWSKALNGMFLAIDVSLVLFGLASFSPLIFKDELTVLGKKVVETLVDGLNFIMVIVLLTVLLNGSAGGIIVGLFSLIGLLFALAYDLISFLKPSTLGRFLFRIEDNESASLRKKGKEAKREMSERDADDLFFLMYHLGELEDKDSKD